MSIQVSAAPWLLAEGWSEGQDLLQLSYFTPPMSAEPCRGFQSCCSESCCVWFAANPACGVAQSSQQEGEMLSVPKLQLLGMVYLPPARNILQKGAEILWRHQRKSQLVPPRDAA